MNNYSDVEQRVKRYWYTDGIVEIVCGGLCFLFGTYFVAQEMLAERSVLQIVLVGVFVLLLVSGNFITSRLVNNLKIRITYPRTGYIDYPLQKQTAWQGMFKLGIVIGILAIMIAIGRNVETYDLDAAFVGLLMGCAMVLVTIRKGGPVRFYILAIISVALGLALSFSGWALNYSLGLYYGLVGIASLISGGVTLRRYVRQNPMPADTEGENE